MGLYKVKIEGTTPLMHHKMTEEALFKLLGTETKAKTDKKNGAKLPREIAESHAYKDKDGSFYIPMDYISGALLAVASEYKQKNSIRRSLKSVISGAVRPMQDKATLKTKKNKPITDFEVDIRKATNHQAGAVAVCRPRFDEWTAEFVLSINEDLLSQEVCQQVLSDAGTRAGVGSFRVENSGYFGQFNITEWSEIKK